VAGLLAILRSILFYAVFYGGTAILMLIGMVAAPMGERALTPVVSAWSRWHRLCTRLLLGIRIAQRGDFPRGAVLVAVKHESFFEAIDLPNLFGRTAIFAKAELLRIPVWGRLAASHGVIPVERDQGAKALRRMLLVAREHAARGSTLVIFPEGTRVPHGSAPPLQAGFAALYKALALPVVPVAVNSGPLYHRRWKRPGTITVSAGEPISPGLPREEIEARVHQAINALNR
jgi:1-acyl-sn-glycerol-3-phosphate acyltransferase